MSLSTLQGIIGVIVAFSVAIFVHELGHFMFAKLFGVKVETFSLGFGKKLFGFRRGDTEYKFCLLPFGGYVKMVGTMSKEMEEVLEGEKPATPEEREEAAEAAVELEAPAPVSLAEGIQDEVNALRNKPYWKKLLVFAAGCINNVLTAILIFFLVYAIGFNDVPPTAPVVAGSFDVPTEVSPLKAGDRLVEVNGKPVKEWSDFAAWFLKKEKPGDFASTVAVTLERDGTSQTIELPRRAPVEPALPEGQIVSVSGEAVESPRGALQQVVTARDQGKTLIDVGVKTQDGKTTHVKTNLAAAAGPWWPALAYDSASPARISLLMPNLPAEKSGLKEGDLVVQVDDVPVANAFQAVSALRSRPGKVAQVKVERFSKDTTKTLTLPLEIRQHPDNPKIGQIGVAFSPARTDFTRYPVPEAFTKAVSSAGGMATAYVRAIGNIFGSSFTTIRESLSGPVGISVQFFKVAQSGWFQFFVTFALFNIVLAMTNLLPLPVLDGGHILFATIEAIIRRPLPAKVMVAIYNVFTFLIIALALLITFNDIIMNSWRVVGK